MAFSINALLLTVHLLAAACWFGAGWYDRLMVSPALKASGPAGVEIIRTFTRQGGGARWFAPASMLTILSGAALYWRLGISPGTSAGLFVTLGALLGLSAMLMGIFLHAPAEKRLKAAVADGTHEQILHLARGLERHTTWSAILVTVAFLAMALRHVV